MRARVIATAAVVAAFVALLGLLDRGAPDAPLAAPPPARAESDAVRAPAAEPTARSTLPQPPPLGAPAGGEAPLAVTVVTGRVVARDGRPIADAVVRLDRESRAGVVELDRDHSATDGRFRLTATTTADVWLAIRSPAHAPLDRRLGSLAAPDARLELGDLRLDEGGRAIGVVVDPDGAVIAGASLRLVALRGRVAPAAGDAVESAADGSFRFERLPLGSFRLEAEAAGFARRTQSAPVTIADGVTADLGRVELRRAAVLSGQVVDRRGRGVSGARVALRPTEPGRGFRDVVTTADDGRFRVEHVPLGGVRVDVSAAGFRSASTAEHRLERAMDLRIVLDDGHALRGRVVDAVSGAPIERFAARLLRVGTPSSGSPRAREAPGFAEPGAADGARPRPELGPSAQHDGGAFHFDGLDDGAYVIEFAAPGYMPARSDLLALSPDLPAPGPWTQPLRPGLLLAGRAQDVDGAPIVGAEIVLRTPGRGDRGPASGVAIARTRTVGAGRFEFDGLAAGRLVLTARHKDFEDHRVELELRADRRDLELLLHAPASLSGVVHGLSGAEHAQVIAFGGAGQMSLAPVGPDGSYHFAALQSGAYIVRAFVGDPHRFLSEEGALFQSAPGAAVAGDVRLQRGQSLRHDLTLSRHPRGSLSGRVTENGRPLAAAVVRAGTFALVRSDDDGRFRIEDLPLGELALIVRPADSVQLERRMAITILRGEANHVDVRFETGRLRGVVDASPELRTSATLKWQRGAQQASMTVPIRDGAFDLPRAPAGPSRLLVPRGEGQPMLETDVVVPVDGLLEVVVRAR